METNKTTVLWESRALSDHESISLGGIKRISNTAIAEGLKPGKVALNPPETFLIEVTLGGFTVAAAGEGGKKKVIDWERVARFMAEEQGMKMDASHVEQYYPEAIIEKTTPARKATIKTPAVTYRIIENVSYIRHRNNLLQQDITAEELHSLSTMHHEGERDQPPEERC